MRLIIPMAGRGTRLRPHTLTTPKPLIKVAGKSIVERLVDTITQLCKTPITEIGFVIGDFGEDVEHYLINICKKKGIKGIVYHQKEALGTAHAVKCAEDLLKGQVIVAFADTLFSAQFTINNESENSIWVKSVKDPSAYGVVKTNKNNLITEFHEKPDTFISNKAIIGIYYFKSGETLSEEINLLITNNIKEKGEFQLTTILRNMSEKDNHFVTKNVDQWLDCGNYMTLLDTNEKILDNNKKIYNIKQKESTIIPPVYIGNNCVLNGSTIGPYVSLEDNTIIKNCSLKNTIVQANSQLNNCHIKDSVIGAYTKINNCHHRLSVGDFTEIY